MKFFVEFPSSVLFSAAGVESIGTGTGLTGLMRGGVGLSAILVPLELALAGAYSHSSAGVLPSVGLSLSLISFSTSRPSVSTGVTSMLILEPREDRRDSNLGCIYAALVIE